ncbi:hypothetical protein SVAN01_11657 [Stagonosporopsis vannaccii]|nr:hypothetical protein SVAN01_11657 [Stagonosporopsis vannaccii]
MLTSLINCCTATKSLSRQYQLLAQELSTLAGRHCLLQREVADIQTDALAYKAIICGYKRDLAAQQATVSRQKEADRDTEILLTKISELQEPKANMHKALIGASQLLAASHEKLHPAHRLGRQSRVIGP